MGSNNKDYFKGFTKGENDDGTGGSIQKQWKVLRKALLETKHKVCGSAK